MPSSAVVRASIASAGAVDEANPLLPGLRVGDGAERDPGARPARGPSRPGLRTCDREVQPVAAAVARKRALGPGTIARSRPTRARAAAAESSCFASGRTSSKIAEGRRRSSRPSGSSSACFPGRTALPPVRSASAREGQLRSGRAIVPGPASSTRGDVLERRPAPPRWPGALAGRAGRLVPGTRATPPTSSRPDSARARGTSHGCAGGEAGPWCLRIAAASALPPKRIRAK